MEPEVLPRDDHEHRQHHDGPVREPFMRPGSRARPSRASRSTMPLGYSSSWNTMPVVASDRTYGAKNSSRSRVRPRNAPVELERQPQRERDLHRQRQDDDEQVVPRPRPEDGVVQCPGVVVEAHEVGERRRGRSSRTGCTTAAWTIGSSTNSPYTASAGSRNSPTVSHLRTGSGLACLTARRSSRGDRHRIGKMSGSARTPTRSWIDRSAGSAHSRLRCLRDGLGDFLRSRARPRRDRPRRR